MDRDDLRSILQTTGVDLWALIGTAISIAVTDHGSELRLRRDGIAEKLYAPIQVQDRNPINNGGGFEASKLGSREREEKSSSSPIDKVFGSSPLTPQSNHPEEEIDEEEGDDDLIDQEQRRILAIKDSLEDPDQSDDAVAGLLQNLADMDITFKALKGTDIGRHVNGLRKHASGEVRRLVKQLVRKWKEIVDEWVKANSENASSAIITDADSPQQIPSKNKQNGHQVPEFAYSPDPNNARMSSNGSSLEPKTKAIPKREVPSKPLSSATPAVNEQKGSLQDGQRLANARKRLQENYQEAQNAKKQRTIQVMDIHEIPKPKNSSVARNNKGPHQAKRW